MSQAGDTGMAALESYQEHQRRADLDVAIGSLLDALVAEPGHPDALEWHWWLAAAFGERGDLDDAVTDWDSAVELTELLVTESGPDDSVHDLAVAVLAERLWTRARLGRFTAITDTAHRIGQLEHEAAHPVARQVVRAFHGFALFEAFQQAGRPADRDRAIALMAEAFDLLSSEPAESDPAHDDPGWAYAPDSGPGLLANTLSYACQTRAADRSDLDRAVEVVRVVIGRYQDEPDRRAMLTETLANAYDLRWQMRAEAGDPESGEDLDASITTWAEAGDNAFTMLMRGSLLVSRADLADSADDARLATELLATAAEQAEPGEADTLWLGGAVAGRIRWEITGELDDLETAAAFAARAIGCATDDDVLLDAHYERIIAEHFLKDNGRIRPGRGTRATLISEVVDDAVRALDRAVRAEPDRRVLLALMTGLLSVAALDAEPGSFDVTRTHGLFAMASGSAWAHVADTGLAVLELQKGIRGPGHRSDYGIPLLAAAHAASGADVEMQERINELLMVAAHVRADKTGDRNDHRTARSLADRQLRWTPPTTGRRLRGGGVAVRDPLFTLLIQVTDLAREGRYEAVQEAVEQAGPLLAERGTGTDSYLVRFLRSLVTVVAPLSQPPLPLLPEQQESWFPGTGIAAAAVTDIATFVQCMARGARSDAVGAVEHLEGVLHRTAAGDRSMRRDLSASAGSLRLTLAQSALLDGTPDADRAAVHFRTALKLSTGPSAPGWALIAISCGHAVRLGSTPDLAAGRALGRSALDAHAWQVFAQAGTDHALAAATAAAKDAAILVQWCLDDRAAGPAVLAELVAALDAARALVLRASSISRRVPDMLRDHSREDLAAEWEKTAGQGRDLLTGAALLGAPVGDAIEVPDALRVQVAALFAGREVTGFEAITIEDIQARLSELGRDALVYLVPGAAVVVPVADRPYLIDLPELVRVPGRRPAGIIADPRDLGAADRSDPADLDALCAWAWRAAIGPLIASAPGRRVVLVPMGELATVPWHAAYRVDDGRRHYAVHDLVISYSPSARLMGGSASPAATGPALIVGNPNGDLPAAGDEALAVHQVFYPDGTHYGVPGDTAGTPDLVLDRLAGQPEGTAVLHFACHAVTDPDRPAEASLMLSGGTLSLRRMLDRSRSADLNVDRVFLAACTTGGTRVEHDEALSLATSFLVAGARTVIGSLWPVPDGDTSLLMFMIHHYLRREGCDPADALHRAQLWMLDQDRAVPAGTPAPLLLRHRAGTVPHLAAWAGFIHIGR